LRGRPVGTIDPILPTAPRTSLPQTPGDSVPIGWIAAGNPAQMFRPDQHEEMWKVLGVFAKTVWGLGAAPPGETIMPVVVDRYARALARHRDDRILDPGNDRLPGV
jgi:hypothetical protein